MSRRIICLAASMLTVPMLAVAQERGLRELTLEELANIQVTSVSRQAESLADAPASVFIITAEEIRRSGATTLPEALRLAPNLQVAQADAAQYAIGARGFNNLVANKLLVLIDGRTVYTPLFSGVFWDQQDVLLDDVDRIEVISGPGATLWGANAVNGVINVVTRAADETQGSLLSLGAGNSEQLAAFRYGGAIGSGHFRVYGKTSRLGNTETVLGAPIADGRRWVQAGFRSDWGSEGNRVTIQGDTYNSRSEDRGSVGAFDLGRVELSGVNLLGRISRQQTERAGFQAQMYFNHYNREEAVLFQPSVDLVDVEAQQDFRGERRRLLVGGGYRRGSDDVRDGIIVGVRPTSRTLNWSNLFAMEEVALTSTLDASAGLKLERNDYTGWEYLPNARLAWKPSAGQLLWGAVSRAVRAPARLDRDVITPFPAGLIIGGPRFVSEVANVFELGYRGQWRQRVTASATLFRHNWDKLRSGTAPPVEIENKLKGPVSGLEAWVTWQTAPAWRQSAGFTTLRKDLRLEPGSTDPVGSSNPQLANDPDGQWMFHSSLTLGGVHELDGVLRHVGALPNPSVPSYTALDLRYGWVARPTLEISVKAENLLGDGHVEFGAAPGRSEFSREVFVQIEWHR